MLHKLPDFLAVDWIGTVVPFFGQEPYPGAVAALARLRASGSTLVVVSQAAQGQIDADVRRVGLRADEVIGCREKGRVLSELRLRYGQGLAFGDRASDLEAAQEAGLPFLQARLEGQPVLDGPDGQFHSWGEVELVVAEA